MRIISNFRDYYDGLQDHNPPIFHRENKIVGKIYPSTDNLIETAYSWVFPKQSYTSTNVYYYILQVCQESYLAIRYSNLRFLSGAQFKEYCLTNQIDNKLYTTNPTFDKPPTIYEPNCIKLWSTKWNKQRTHLILDKIVEFNPKLKDWNFQSIMRVETLFQEIEMWQSNVANPEKPIPPIDDVTLAESKGFNKYSFRKDKKSSK